MHLTFTTNYGEQLSEKTVKKAFSKYAEKAKIARSVSSHILRHNFGTMSAESGMSIFHLQKILGHAEIATTGKYMPLSEECISEQHGKQSPLSRIMRRKRKGKIRIVKLSDAKNM
ncbi:tyrosine-type recombinase/integrase [Paenibacillus dendritiformis]|uniref:tyrosine-type recombinase/integrase n=1 Tax=Paenibacillus dendritiformis TaxID=130049 RepID=UPI001EE66E92|nr:tyrosine-type recombinase/integrase [Paenibacillus dendritiformis]CAH8767827.1 tyrosine-type recombinase/integrase [Paenibacillus dendritiformis]